MSEYKAIPVEAAMFVAQRFNKDIVIIAAWDRESDLLHVTTYGTDPLYKVNAAKGGETVATALGCGLKEKVDYEDFRRDHNAARERAMSEAIAKHLPALKQMGAQILHPSENTFTRMVTDFERAIGKASA